MTSLPYQDILNKLDTSHSLEETWKIAVNFFNQQQITHILYVYCRGYKNTVADTILLSTMPQWWIERYQERGYARFDPFFKYCCTTYETVKTGIEYYNDYDYLNQEERDLIQEASKTGFTAGASFTMRRMGLGKDFGGWNLGTSLSRDKFDKLYEEKSDMLRIVAMYMHERLNIQLQKDQEETIKYQQQTLSERQVDCLKLLAQGKRIKQIADILSIQPITVDHHIKMARESLQATTREQAIARAILKGLIHVH